MILKKTKKKHVFVFHMNGFVCFCVVQDVCRFCVVKHVCRLWSITNKFSFIFPNS